MDTLQRVLVCLCHVLYIALLQLLRYIACGFDPNIPSGYGPSKFLLHHVQLILGVPCTWTGKQTQSLLARQETQLHIFVRILTILTLLQKIPKWWVWGYWICPVAWSLNGLLTSQYGDLNREIVVHGEEQTISAFLESIHGYYYDELKYVAIVLFAFPLVFAFAFGVATEKLNFQRR